ncbi:hypothetical protein DFP72DRAFT_890837 [Ephemerocybe angulata]|uniref:Uncharacterized protein n=1 Tax=Ephemerocybe angulata TaxID=980116 RepID=A0A8H6I3J8_9AGAR|nr:hypothetical protein DFP72DRAFT_890837 [Tulosesus angulatus]
MPYTWPRLLAEQHRWAYCGAFELGFIQLAQHTPSTRTLNLDCTFQTSTQTAAPDMNIPQKSTAKKKIDKKAGGKAPESPKTSSQGHATHHQTNYEYSVDSVGSALFGDSYGTIIQHSYHGSPPLSVAAAYSALEKNVALDASHDSVDQCAELKCTKETREAVEEELLDWVPRGGQDKGPKRIVWLTSSEDLGSEENTPSEAGENDIARSVAKQCKQKKLLAAEFFFSPQGGHIKKPLIASLAHQLIQHDCFPGLRQHVLSAIQRCPDVFTESLQEQFNTLILGPLRELEKHVVDSDSAPKVIIIGGLDDCQADQFRDGAEAGTRLQSVEDQVEILTTLYNAINDSVFPFRLLIACRPKPSICDFFASIAVTTTRKVLLNEEYDPDKDVRLFYRSKLSVIRRRYEYEPQWPGPNNEGVLVQNASGNIQFASAAMIFVEGGEEPGPGVKGDSRIPKERLSCILGLLPATAGGTSNPREPLDHLYRALMNACPDPSLSMKWIRAIHTLTTQGLGGSSDSQQGVQAWLVRLILELTPGEEARALSSLSPIMNLPDPDDDVKCYSFYNKSFITFIEDPDRCLDLHISEEDVKDFIANRYFQTLAEGKHIESLDALLKKHKQYRAGQSPYRPSSYTAFHCNRDVRPKQWYDGEGPKFLVASTLAFSSKEAFMAAESDMMACNVKRWVKTNSALETGGHSEETAFVVMFHFVHKWCSRGWFGGCLPACKHWRKEMIAARRDEERKVPRQLDLLLNRLDHNHMCRFHPLSAMPQDDESKAWSFLLAVEGFYTYLLYTNIKTTALVSAGIYYLGWGPVFLGLTTVFNFCVGVFVYTHGAFFIGLRTRRLGEERWRR